MLQEDYSSLPFFHGMTEQQLQLVNTVMLPRAFLAGQLIFGQGQAAANLYILVRGVVVVRYKPYDGPELTVARIAPGGVFGWSAAMGRKVYSSGAYAEEDSLALEFEGSLLHNFCECNPEIGAILLEHLANGISERLRNTHAEVLTILTQGMDLSADCWKRIRTDG